VIANISNKAVRGRCCIARNSCFRGLRPSPACVLKLPPLPLALPTCQQRMYLQPRIISRLSTPSVVRLMTVKSPRLTSLHHDTPWTRLKRKTVSREWRSEVGTESLCETDRRPDARQEIGDTVGHWTLGGEDFASSCECNSLPTTCKSLILVYCDVVVSWCMCSCCCRNTSQKRDIDFFFTPMLVFLL
jgi:hypothetical protein